MGKKHSFFKGSCICTLSLRISMVEEMTLNKLVQDLFRGLQKFPGTSFADIYMVYTLLNTYAMMVCLLVPLMRLPTAFGCLGSLLSTSLLCSHPKRCPTSWPKTNSPSKSCADRTMTCQVTFFPHLLKKKPRIYMLVLTLFKDINITSLKEQSKMVRLSLSHSDKFCS